MASVKEKDIEAVMNQLSQGRRSTAELLGLLDKEIAGCPDEIVRILMRLRREGRLNGEFSQEKGTWEWWIE